jgi:uncharacterized protein
MAKLAPYSVLVRDLPTHRRFEVPSERVAEWVKGLPMRDALGAPEGDPQAGHGVADLDLYADGTHVFAAGEFRGEVTVACSRCVEPVKLPIEEKLRVTFMPRHEVPGEDGEDGGDPRGGAEADEGAEVADEDLDLFPYDGELVDLEPLFREQFVLAVPFAPLCREDCKGLCPQCGIDRNTGTCSCEPPIDPRLAGLKGLKLPP